MIFESTYSENIKRLVIKKEIGYITLGENYTCFDYSDFNYKAIKLAEKYNIDISKVKFYTTEIEMENFDKEFRLVFYYEGLETEAEYAGRIEKLKLKDLCNSIKEIRAFNCCVTQKKELVGLYSELVLRGKYKGLKDDVFESFLTDESVEERINAAYKRGLKEGEDKLKEYKKKVKEITG